MALHLIYLVPRGPSAFEYEVVKSVSNQKLIMIALPIENDIPAET